VGDKYAEKKAFLLQKEEEYRETRFLLAKYNLFQIIEEKRKSEHYTKLMMIRKGID